MFFSDYVYDEYHACTLLHMQHHTHIREKRPLTHARRDRDQRQLPSLANNVFFF